ncbi:MAG: Hsp20/alpha crystallin family protein [Gammaproteobacteria bacterium]|nr:Hsp20/alpha crystallin family protein [Gammaproteobacteria bacterium]
MKNNIFIIFLASFIVNINSYAEWSYSLDITEGTNSSGLYNSSHIQPPQHLRIVRFQDLSDFYIYIELVGIKPEEIDIQRQGTQIIIRQIRGHMEETESEGRYQSFQSYSSFTRRLNLPPNADPDISKMKRINEKNYIRLMIPKRN